MNICILLLLGVVGASGPSLTAKEILRQWKGNIDPHVDECKEATQVDLKHVHNFYVLGTLVEDSNMKCNLKCYGEKLHLLKPDGSIDTQKWSELFVGVTPEIAQKCAHSAATDPCERVFQVVNCAFKNVWSNLKDKDKEV